MMSPHASGASVPDFFGLASAAARVHDYPALRLIQEFIDPETGDLHAIVVIEHIVRHWADFLRGAILAFAPIREDQEEALLEIRKRMERELVALQTLLHELVLLLSSPPPSFGTSRGPRPLVLADLAWTEDRPMASGWYWHSRGPNWWRHGPIAIFVDEEQSVWAPGQTKRIPLMLLDEWEGLWLGPLDGPQVPGHGLAS